MARPVNELSRKRCQPCEGGIRPLPPGEVHALLTQLPAWTLTPDRGRLRREWRAKGFAAALAFFGQVGELAEREGHHPDLHLTRYRDVTIEVWAHAAGGLTENDFILAAMSDELPVELKG